MSDQLGLAFERKHEAAYRRHRERHPEVLEELVAAAREAQARGWTRLGIRALWERMRWKRGPKPKDEAGYYLNDHLTSFYAREIRDTYPDLAGLFEIRERR